MISTLRAKSLSVANELFGGEKEKHSEIEKQIISILESKIRPAVAKDGGDIKFKEFKDGDCQSRTTR